MILLDTHVCFRWVQGDPAIAAEHVRAIEGEMVVRADVRVNIFSCWEVAKLVEYGRVWVADPIDDWLRQALEPSGLRAEPLSLEIVTEATRLPGSFHRDPADQIIVATARALGCTLATDDRRIRAYPHVSTVT